MAVFAALMFPTIAHAEICDKAVGERWRSDDGPVWLLNPVGFPFALTILVGGLFLLAVAKIRWLQWFGYVMSAFLLFIAAIAVTADLIPQHDIYLAQIREGCRSYRTDLANVALLLAFALVYAWRGYRLRRGAAVGASAGN